MIEEKKLIEEIDKEIDGVIVKDTYSRGKNAGLRKARILAEEQPKIGKWIPCSERLPEEHDSVFKRFKGTDKWNSSMFETTSNKMEITVEDEKGKRATTTAHTCDGKWKLDSWMNVKVIAWKPFSEPYMEDCKGD